MSFIRKLKSALGNSKDTETTSGSDTIEAIIKDIEHEPFAVADANVLYAGLNELGGYYFFQTVIVGSFKVKTKNGGQLIMTGKNIELELTSDSVEFESDSTDIKGRSITKIDFQIEEEDVAKITKEDIAKLVLKCKSFEVPFSISNGELK